MNTFMADAPSSISISPDEFRFFHSMDRKLYAVLINDLLRDPVESMRVMALWLWLEQSGFKNMISKLLALPPLIINELAEEAVISLKYLYNSVNNNADQTSPLSEPSDNFPLTQNFVDSKISASFFHKNRLMAIQGISKVISNVCVKSMTDIMEQAMERNLIQYMSLMHVSPPPPPPPPPPPSPTVTITGFDLPGREVNLHPDERTMFVTFSKGYPVSEREIKDFFAKFIGDKIESLYMQEVLPGEQSLFARIVFYSPSSIKLILNGAEKVKFSINGKHVWMRKYVAKRLQKFSASASASASPSSPVLSTANISPSLISHFL